MQPSPLIDDATTEALLAAEANGRHGALGRTLDAIRAAGADEAPAPSAELAALFAGAPAGNVRGADVREIGAAACRRDRRRALRAVGGLGLAAKIALGAGAAAAAVGGAHAGGVLPAPVEHLVDDLVDVVAPPSDPPAPPEQAPAGDGRSSTQQPSDDTPSEGAEGTPAGRGTGPPGGREGSVGSKTVPEPPGNPDPGKPDATPGSPPAGAGTPPDHSNAGGNGSAADNGPPNGTGNPATNGSADVNAGGGSAPGAAANGATGATGAATAGNTGANGSPK